MEKGLDIDKKVVSNVKRILGVSKGAFDKRCCKNMAAGLLLAALLAGAPTLYTKAAQGTVTYGSESYGWYTGEICPMGVYVNSEVPVGNYEICLTFDESMLRYLDGATEKIENRLYIRGTGSETSYKNMLHFEPMQPGTTSIQVISANCMTVAGTSIDISGNVFIDPAGEIPAEAIEMVQLSTAPITISQAVSSRLRELAAGALPVEGFAPEVFDYYLTVEPEIENLNLTYAAEDEAAIVTVSDTALAVGEKIVKVTVKGTAEENVYTLHVTRKESVIETPKPTSTPKPEETMAPEKVPEESLSGGNMMQEGGSSPDEAGQQDSVDASGEAAFLKKPAVQFLLNAPILWFATAAVGILTVTYILRLFGKRKRQTVIEEEQEETLKVINLEQTVIDVQHVSMQFKMAQDEASSLKEYLIRTVKGQNHYHYLMALDDVSFEVKQGDVVGIIGTNGSGKSTLLKIISGALNPAGGHVEVDRSKVQMLTLGTGFDMELTAKENVYLNGAIIGYTREYIDEKYDEIVEFAELEGFMEERMKNFSSGMVSRLGFAIATMRDAPDILILDEVLSVGDMFFRQKSLNRIKEMIHSGATVLIVSHEPDVILKNCNRAVWIEKGVLQMAGDPKQVCESYNKYEVHESMSQKAEEDMEEELEDWEEDVEDIGNTED